MAAVEPVVAPGGALTGARGPATSPALPSPTCDMSAHASGAGKDGVAPAAAAPRRTSPVKRTYGKRAADTARMNEDLKAILAVLSDGE